VKIIGINGLKTAGKDTTYECVRTSLRRHVKRAAFADKLKIMAMLALGYEGEPAS
jgi:molybdopterin-guanine dinucleotide biosynthesis protein